MNALIFCLSCGGKIGFTGWFGFLGPGGGAGCNLFAHNVQIISAGKGSFSPCFVPQDAQVTTTLFRELILLTVFKAASSKPDIKLIQSLVALPLLDIVQVFF